MPLLVAIETHLIVALMTSQKLDFVILCLKQSPTVWSGTPSLEWVETSFPLISEISILLKDNLVFD